METRKHVWITGANSGLGLATSRALALAGWFVSMACRNEERGQRALAEVHRAAGRDSARLVLCDLASLDSVRKATTSLPKSHPTLHALVNNAATIQAKRQETDDGFEMQLGVNHLGHFLLSHRLQPFMDTSGPDQARIVNVTSGAHKIGRIHWNDLQLEQGYGPFRSYAQTKLANILFTYELARRLDGRFHVNCIHPGAIASNFGRESGGALAAFIFTVFRPFFLTAEQAAKPLVQLVDGSKGAVTGKYFSRHKEVRSSPASYDIDAAQRLWSISTDLIDLTDEERRRSGLYRQ